MTSLQNLIGIESDLEQVADVLRHFAVELGPQVVGAYHLTCSDEAERECEETFRNRFVRRLLPELKRGTAVALRTTNLGGRYEQGAIHIAEGHYSAQASGGSYNLLIAKINSHVAVGKTDGEPEYGNMIRYGADSHCCGALAGVFAGSTLPAIDELRELFNSGGEDRVAALADPGVVDPRYRLLLAAVLNARMQAYRVVMDICEHHPATPTIYLVVPCVTLNRPGPDTELVIGQFHVDCTGADAQIKYSGLSTDPAAYVICHDEGRVMIEDACWPEMAEVG